MTYLLDTNVVSELRKRDPDPHMVAWYSRVKDEQLFLSAITVSEIRRVIERLRSMTRGWTLVTRNTSDFPVGLVAMLNPFVPVD